MTAVASSKHSVRGADGKFAKATFGEVKIYPDEEHWPDSEILAELPQGDVIIACGTKKALCTLGDQQGHCTNWNETHWVNSAPRGKRKTGFIVLLDAKGVARCSIHCKRLDLCGKEPMEYDSFSMEKGSYREKPGKRNNPMAKKSLEQQLKKAKYYYEREKEYAIKHYGPLGPNNRLKYHVDYANKRVTACMAALEKGERKAGLYPGRIFSIENFEEGKKFYILSVHGSRGMDYEGADERGQALVALLGKELDVK